MQQGWQQVDGLLIDFQRALQLRRIADHEGVSMQAWVERAIAEAYAKLPTDKTSARPGEIPVGVVEVKEQRYRVFVREDDLYAVLGALMQTGLVRIGESFILQMLEQDRASKARPE